MGLQMADDLGGISGDHDVGGNVFRDYGTGADDSVVADSDAGHHSDVASEPDVFAERDGFSPFEAFVAALSVKGMAGGIEGAVGAYEAVFADSHLRLVKDGTPHIHVGPLPYLDIETIVDMDGGFDYEMLRSLADDLTQESLPFLYCFGQKGIELVKESLAAAALREQFGVVVGVIDFAGQHFFFFSHKFS